MSDTITDRLIKFSVVDVPENAAVMMRLSLFDWAACGIAGAQDVEFAPFKEDQLALCAGPHRVFGGGSTSAPGAAIVNGTLSHALDYDDTHFGHIGHPSVAVLPAVLALAEQNGADFSRFIQAATIGVEASILVGLWLGRNHYQLGYHQTATAGSFGATLGACRLLKLTPEQTRHALGLCASMASGIKAQFGTMGKPLNAGLAARTGVEASLWAKSGMTAAHDGLAGALGFGPTHHGQAADVKMSTDAWRFLSISHKFHACCHGLHAMLEALQDLELNCDEVDTLHIITHPRWMSVCNVPSPQTGLSAKFSYVQTAAMSLLGHDTSAIANFTDEITQDSQVVNLRGRITVSEDDSLAETESKVEAIMLDGSIRRSRHDLMSPMTNEVRTVKLRTKAEALLGESHTLSLWEASQGMSLADFTEQFGLL